ncbi:MAG: SRPBCC family protein [Pseudonocardiales bacterium]|nr:SRPBCC family protein [Pseudonocardiales bacterium]
MTVRRGLPWSWGATDAEIDAHYPCADLVPDPAARMIRAVDVAAPADVTFRWVCQLTRAPYSYDLVDNLGRRSPRTLTPGADTLAPGTPFVMIFEVAAVERGREITGVGRPGPVRRFGPMACTYRVVPAGPAACRLIGRLDLTASRLGTLIAWGDLVMMRKQLRTLAACAERTAHPLRPEGSPPEPPAARPGS